MNAVTVSGTGKPLSSARTWVVVAAVVAAAALLLTLNILHSATSLTGFAPNTSGSVNAAVLAPAAADASDQLLVWIGNGSEPGKQTASDPGKLAFMDGTGETTALVDVPQQTSRVEACGDTATSPDGNMFAFYIGLDAGKLYLKKGMDTAAPIGDVHALTCLGGGTFRYSPDSARLGYIAYEADAERSEFADGHLHIVNTGDLSEALNYENVTAFDMNNDGVALVSFFTSDKNEADEAAVIWWDGSAQKEVATLTPESDDCKFTSASIAILPDGKWTLVMGHRCKKGDTRTSWQLYVVDPEARSATLAASDYQEGQFAAFARTNSIFVSPDGSRAYFTVPDGVTANTAGIKMVGLGDLALTDVLERQAIMATFSGGANAFPRVSPDGTWLALVVTTPNNSNTVEIWNLADASVAPIKLDAGSAGDTISNMEFTRDSKRLLLIAGGNDKTNNSLVAIDLASGNNFRVARGHFASGLAVSPDGTQVAVNDWQIPEDPQQPAYLNTLIVNVDSSETVTVFEGADIVDGKVQNQRFAYPLDWQSAAAEPAS